MKQLICNFLEVNNYPEKAREEVLKAYDILGNNEQFNFLLKNFYSDESINVDVNDSPLAVLCEENSCNFYTAKLLFYICLSEELHKQYQIAGICDEMYYTAIGDIYSKMMECFDVHGVYGIFSTGWFVSVYRMKTLGLGRLFYNFGVYDGEEFFIGERKVEKGDKFISIHIPSGKPFVKEARFDSYERAYNYFKDSFDGKEPLFRCETWLLNPVLRDILDEKSNIISFMNEFRITESGVYDSNIYLWRVFGADYLLPADKLPRDNSLRKAYADYLAEGNSPGFGVGFFLYDPINKTTII